MDLVTYQAFAVFVILTTLSVTCGSPTRTAEVLQEDSRVHLFKRPKYMDTRDLDKLKDVVLFSVQKLVDEGRLNSAILPQDDSSEQVGKRERYMGICMRKQYNNFIPFPCLRSGR